MKFKQELLKFQQHLIDVGYNAEIANEGNGSYELRIPNGVPLSISEAGIFANKSNSSIFGLGDKTWSALDGVIDVNSEHGALMLGGVVIWQAKLLTELRARNLQRTWVSTTHGIATELVNDNQKNLSVVVQVNLGCTIPTFLLKTQSNWTIMIGGSKHQAKSTYQFSSYDKLLERLFSFNLLTREQHMAECMLAARRFKQLNLNQYSDSHK